MKKDIAVMNVRLTKEQARELDELIAKKAFSSRSEAIREFCREYVREHVREAKP
jgi:metal-responsive CopG/Arc/MetJ family transcriptional regulator